MDGHLDLSLIVLYQVVTFCAATADLFYFMFQNVFLRVVIVEFFFFVAAWMVFFADQCKRLGFGLGVSIFIAFASYYKAAAAGIPFFIALLFYKEDKAATKVIKVNEITVI